MLLHSIAAHDAVFPQDFPERCCISYQNCRMEGSLQNGQFCICRILSTDPADFLRYAPGQLLPVEQHKQH